MYIYIYIHIHICDEKYPVNITVSNLVLETIQYHICEGSNMKKY